MNYLGRQAIQYPTKDGDKEIKQTKEIGNYKNINALANVYMVLNESATASITANHKASELDYGDSKRVKDQTHEKTYRLYWGHRFNMR